MSTPEGTAADAPTQPTTARSTRKKPTKKRATALPSDSAAASLPLRTNVGVHAGFAAAIAPEVVRSPEEELRHQAEAKALLAELLGGGSGDGVADREEKAKETCDIDSDLYSSGSEEDPAPPTKKRRTEE